MVYHADTPQSLSGIRPEELHGAFVQEAAPIVHSLNHAATRSALGRKNRLESTCGSSLIQILVSLISMSMGSTRKKLTMYCFHRAKTDADGGSRALQSDERGEDATCA